MQIKGSHLQIYLYKGIRNMQQDKKENALMCMLSRCWLSHPDRLIIDMDIGHFLYISLENSVRDHCILLAYGLAVY